MYAKMHYLTRLTAAVSAAQRVAEVAEESSQATKCSTLSKVDMGACACIQLARGHTSAVLPTCVTMRRV